MEMETKATGRKRGRPRSEESQRRHAAWFDRYLEGASYQRIAAADGVTDSAVWQGVHREAARRGVAVPVHHRVGPRGNPWGTGCNPNPEARARWARMFDRYLEGLTLQQVADEFGVTLAVVHRAVQRELKLRGLRLRRVVQAVPLDAPAGDLADELQLAG